MTKFPKRLCLPTYVNFFIPSSNPHIPMDDTADPTLTLTQLNEVKQTVFLFLSLSVREEDKISSASSISRARGPPAVLHCFKNTGNPLKLQPVVLSPAPQE